MALAELAHMSPVKSDKSDFSKGRRGAGVRTVRSRTQRMEAVI